MSATVRTVGVPAEDLYAGEIIVREGLLLRVNKAQRDSDEDGEFVLAEVRGVINGDRTGPVVFSLGQIVEVVR